MMPFYLQDSNLSFKSKAIFAMLEHEPTLSVRKLASLSSETRGSVENGLRELIEKNYLINHHSGGASKPKRVLFPHGPHN